MMVTLAACVPIEDRVIQPRDPSLNARVLTYDGDDRYELSLSGTTMVARASTSNTGGNTRIAFTPAGSASRTDQQSCASWSSQAPGRDQQGAALRVVATQDGATKGITVTKNIWFGATWIFNVHLWDTSQSQVFTQIAQFDLSTAFRRGDHALPLPWSICARVVGNTVSFIVWPSDQAQPAWDNPDYGGSVTLPAGWDHPGVPGWYVGHLAAGDEARFDGGTAGPVPSVPAPQSRMQTVAPAVTPRAPTAIASAR